MARRGLAWRGWARLDTARKGRHGEVRQGEAGHGRERQAWRDVARPGSARHGGARMIQGR